MNPSLKLLRAVLRVYKLGLSGESNASLVLQYETQKEAYADRAYYYKWRKEEIHDTSSMFYQVSVANPDTGATMLVRYSGIAFTDSPEDKELQAAIRDASVPPDISFTLPTEETDPMEAINLSELLGDHG